MKHTILIAIILIIYSCNNNDKVVIGNLSFPPYKGKPAPQLSDYPEKLDSVLINCLSNYYPYEFKINKKDIRHTFVYINEEWQIDTNDYQVNLKVSSEGKVDKWYMNVRKPAWKTFRIIKNKKELQ